MKIREATLSDGQADRVRPRIVARLPVQPSKLGAGRHRFTEPAQPARVSPVAGVFIQLKEFPDHASVIHHERPSDAVVFSVLESHAPDAVGVLA